MYNFRRCLYNTLFFAKYFVKRQRKFFSQSIFLINQYKISFNMSENIKITNANFMVLDTSPSPVLIDIDHPHKFRKKSKPEEKPCYSIFSENQSKSVEVTSKSKSQVDARQKSHHKREKRKSEKLLGDRLSPNHEKREKNKSKSNSKHSDSRSPTQSKKKSKKISDDHHHPLTQDPCSPLLSHLTYKRIKKNKTKLILKKSKASKCNRSKTKITKHKSSKIKITKHKSFNTKTKDKKDPVKDDDDDDDIIYEGTFASSYIPFKDRHKKRLCNAKSLLQPSNIHNFHQSKISSNKYSTHRGVSYLNSMRNLLLNNKKEILNRNMTGQNIHKGSMKSPVSNDDDDDDIIVEEIIDKCELEEGEILDLDDCVSCTNSDFEIDNDTVPGENMEKNIVCSDIHHHVKENDGINEESQSNLKCDVTSVIDTDNDFVTADTTDNTEVNALEINCPEHSSKQHDVRYFGNTITTEPENEIENAVLSVGDNLGDSLDEDSDNYESTSMDIELDDNSNESIIDVHNSDFLPFRDIKLSDVTFDVDIPDEIISKRKKLESLRKWEFTNFGKDLYNFTKQAEGTIFTVLSYNVLAQQLIYDNKHLYENCNPEYLDWSYRWPLLQHEIKHLEPDILTLQEVQSSHFHSYYLPWFTYMGYKCIYKKRTGEKVDGCAIMYNSKKFELIEENSVEFNQPSAGPILDRDNVGIIVKLTPTTFYFPFCVATTHLLFNPNRSDIKLAQMVLFLTELDRISYKTEKGGRPVYCPVILTGDFNVEPYTPLMHFIRKGSLKYTGVSKRTLKDFHRGPAGLVFGNELLPPSFGISDYCQHDVLNQGRYLEKIRGSLFSQTDKRKIEEELIKISHSDRKKSLTQNLTSGSSSSSNMAQTNNFQVSSGIIHHGFHFKSVYYHKPRGFIGTKEVTTFQDRWITVDYIFYTKILHPTKSDSFPVEGALKLIAKYRLLSDQEANQIGSIPCDICPSDHYPLAAQFFLKKCS